jgi:small-conductance mechanosensitive channel
VEGSTPSVRTKERAGRSEVRFLLCPQGLMEILKYRFLDNSLGQYLLALAVFAGLFLLLKIFRLIVVKKLKRITAKTKTEFDDFLVEVIESIGWLFYFLISLYLAVQFLTLPLFAEKIVYWALLIVVVYYLAKAVQKFIDYGFKKILNKGEREDKKFDPSALKVLSKLIKVVLWLLAIIIVLENFGYNISAIAAGLGIGGLAIAFALQNILSDIFASFSIYFDKPFQSGDFIIVGSDMGVVKKIGIKSTRIQTLQGEELVISNKQLTEERIHNYKKMSKRRIVFSFGVVYETPVEKLRKIPAIVKEIIDKVELADLDRAHFRDFGDFSLNFEVVYYLESGDYNTYMDVQQKINLALKERFEKEGIEFAYPTQTVFVNKSSAGPIA